MSEKDNVIEGQVVKKSLTDNAMVPVDKASIVMPALTAGEALKAWEAYLNMKASLKTKDDVQIIEKREFLKKSYWRKIATFYNLTVEKIDESNQQIGATLAFHFTCRAIAPNGRTAVGTGSCDVYEKAEFRDGRYMVAKKEWSASLKKMIRVKDKKTGEFIYDPATPNSIHNTRSTAETRAFNRCVSNLVGGGEVSAEEVNSVQEQIDAAEACEETAAPAAGRPPAATTHQAPKDEAPKGNAAAKTGNPTEVEANFAALENKRNALGKIEPVCVNCEAKVDSAVFHYAYNNFGKVLCRDCQKVYASCRKDK